MSLSNSEIEKIANDVDAELEALLEKKLPRLPKGIRTYVRRLKATDERETAEIIAQEFRDKKRPLRKSQIAQLELFNTIDQILITDNPNGQMENQVRAVWLMEASGMITNSERRDYLLEIISASEEIGLESEIETVLVTIRDQLQKLLPHT